MTHSAFALTLNHWRFYLDGSESGSTPAAGEDTGLGLTMGSGDISRQIRWLLEETGSGSGSGSGPDTYQLQFSLNGGTWTHVTASSSVVQAFTGSSLTDGGATTNRGTNGLTDPSGPAFLAGVQEEGDGVFTFAHAADQFTEHVYAFTIVDADVSNADTIDLRVSYNGGDSGISHGVTLPRITITKSSTTSVSLSVAATGSPAAGGKTSKTLAGAATTNAVLAAAVLVPQSLGALSLGAPSLAPFVTVARVFAIAAGTVTGMVRGISKSLGAVMAGNASSARKIAKALTAGDATVLAGLGGAVTGSESLSVSATAAAGLAETFTAGTGPVAAFLRKVLRAILRPVMRS